MSESTLENDLSASFTSQSLTELSADLSEAFIDSLIRDGIIKDIPILGSLIKITKAGADIKNYFFLKKVHKMLFELREIPPVERTKFIIELDKFDKQQKAAETLLHLIDRYDHIEKVTILSNLIKSKIKGKIDTITFFRLASTVEKAFIHDIKKLIEYREGKQYFDHETDSLVSIGLIYHSLFTGGGGEKQRFTITTLGKDLIEYGLNS